MAAVPFQAGRVLAAVDASIAHRSKMPAPVQDADADDVMQLLFRLRIAAEFVIRYSGVTGTMPIEEDEMRLIRGFADID